MNVALPEELVKKVDKIVKESGLGYTSRSELVKEALRYFLKNLTEYKTQSK